ncbi:MAG: hypothetical protein P8X57_05515 [Cyclobacteriaceae bacterium]
MNTEGQLQYCRICTNRKTDATFGVICGLTQSKPDFNSECSKFQIDEQENRRLSEREKAIEEESESGFFSLEQKGLKKGIAGGLLMMAIAAIWFVAGWSAGYIFYYPPILFLISRMRLAFFHS